MGLAVKKMSRRQERVLKAWTKIERKESHGVAKSLWAT